MPPWHHPELELGGCGFTWLCTQRGGCALGALAWQALPGGQQRGAPACPQRPPAGLRHGPGRFLFWLLGPVSWAGSSVLRNLDLLTRPPLWSLANPSPLEGQCLWSVPMASPDDPTAITGALRFLALSPGAGPPSCSAVTSLVEAEDQGRAPSSGGAAQ